MDRADLSKVCTNPQMCLNLLYLRFSTDRAASAYHGAANPGGGQRQPVNGIDLIADLVMTMSPVIEQTGVATAEEIDIATLHSRVHADVAKSRSVVVGRYEVGAWCRLP